MFYPAPQKKKRKELGLFGGCAFCHIAFELVLLVGGLYFAVNIVISFHNQSMPILCVVSFIIIYCLLFYKK